MKWSFVAILTTLGIISAIGGFFYGDNKVAGLAGLVMVMIGIGAARMPVEELITLMQANRGVLTVKKAASDQGEDKQLK